MLRRQTLTLLVTLATLVATVWLYVVIPKGFLPPQDTGLIMAVSEAGTEVSFEQMQRLQAQVEAAIKKDPDVTGVVSIIGVSRMNPTPNAGRLAITLRPRDERRAGVDEIVARMKQAVAPIPGHDGLLPAGAGHPDQHAREPRAVPVHAGRRRRRNDVVEWSDKLVAATAAGSACCARWPRRRRRAACACMVEVDRETAGRLGVSMQAVNDTLNDAFGQRQISTIYAQANQYRVILEAQPRYQRDPTALSKLYVRRRHQHRTRRPAAPRAVNANTSATQHVTGSTRSARASRASSTLGAARDRASGAVSRRSPSASTSRPARR